MMSIRRKKVFWLITTLVGSLVLSGCGGGTDFEATRPPGLVFTTSSFVGAVGVPNDTDGTGTAAEIRNPTGLAFDTNGNLWVTSSPGHRVRKVTPAGVVTTIAGDINNVNGLTGGAGSADGTGAAAFFSYPTGIAADANGNLYIADNGNSTIRKMTPAGVVTTFAGTAGVVGALDGTGSAASFNSPAFIAIDSIGNLFVTDSGNNIIRKITPAGVVTTIAGTAGVLGSLDGTGSAAQFNSPGGIAIDSSGNLFVTEDGNFTIRKITPAGVVTTIAGLALSQGTADGVGSAARFKSPEGIAVDSTGNLYVADQWSHTIRKITPAGVVTTIAGTAGQMGYSEGIGSAAKFKAPFDVKIDSSGNLFVADLGNMTIRKITVNR